MVRSLYPPSPLDVPEDLAHPSADYRRRVAWLLLAIGAFFVLYLALTLSCAAFIIWALCTVVGAREKDPLLVLKISLTVPFALLLFYLIKSLFRGQDHDRTYDVEIFEEQHPRLFEFIEKVCDDTGAPFPKRVFVNFEVNASAWQEASLLHLFVPSDKYLTIGLGLVNSINLTEFKALLAHEFGHFSQKSMKLNGYVYTAARITEGMVHGRDGFDRFIEAWCGVDPRLAWPAWIFWAILWLLRHVIVGLHHAIFFFDGGRRQQMEFNADLVAVSVTGSDAPVHLLYRAVFAEGCLNQAIADMQTAMQHHLYSADMFHHQTHAVDYLRRRAKDPDLGKPPPSPRDDAKRWRIFRREDKSVAQMWVTHPSNYEREKNAKAFYIRTQFDKRSPWLLFDRVNDLREDVTVAFYRFHFKLPKKTVLAEPEEIQAFIDAERAECTYNPMYEGLYDGRDLMVDNVHRLAEAARDLQGSVAELAAVHSNLYAAIKKPTKLFYRRLEEQNRLRAIDEGWHKPENGEFDFRGDPYDERDAKRLLKKIDRELKKDYEWLAELDRSVFETHFRMALHLGGELADDLSRRYRFHLALQRIWRALRDQELALEMVVAFLANTQNPNLEPAVFAAALEVFRTTHHTLKTCLRDSEEMTLPVLQNMTDERSLRSFLLEKRLVDAPTAYDTTLRPKWILKLRKQFHEVKQKCDRVHYKSLGGILNLQERVSAEWFAQQGQVLAPPQKGVR